MNFENIIVYPDRVLSTCSKPETVFKTSVGAGFSRRKVRL